MSLSLLKNLSGSGIGLPMNIGAWKIDRSSDVGAIPVLGSVMPE